MGKHGGAAGRKKKKGARSKAAAGAASAPPDDFEAATERAQEALSRFDYVAACEMLQHALRMRPDDIETLDTLGEVLLTYLGDEERGSAALQHSVQLAPNTGHAKYFSLAQLAGGREGLGLYARGLANLSRALQTAQQLGSQEEEELRLSGAQAHCAVAELWTTDLCMEEQAELRCEEAVRSALALVPGDIEAHYLLAQLRLRQMRIDECRSALQSTCQLLFACADDDRLPSFEIRVEIAKLLMQVDEWGVAYDVLKSLLMEDDGNGFVWYLLSECSRRLGKLPRALRHLRRAKGIAQRVVSSGAEHDAAQEEGGAADFLRKVGEMESQLLAELGPAAPPADAEWVTDSEDDGQGDDGDDDEADGDRVMS